MTSGRGGWNDARLAAAFAARAGLVRSTPADLTVNVLARLASRPAHPAAGIRRMAPGLGLAAVVLVVVAIGAGQLAQTPPAASSSPNASDVAATRPPPSSAPTASPAVAASVVGELLANPITVSEAINRRDANLDDTEMAVKGYAWFPTGGVIDCLDLIGRPATFAGCERRFTWLAESAETRPGLIAPQPASAAFNLFIQPETFVWDQVAGAPTQVIALGHFDDHRSGQCPAERVEGCRNSFVVDELIDPNRPGRTQGLVRVDQSAAILTTIDDAIHFAGLEPGDPSIVAAFAVQNRNLAGFEPAAVGAPELKGNTVWIVRWVDGSSGRPVVRTRLVTDDEPDHRGIGSFEVDAGGLHAVPPAPVPTNPDDPFSVAPTTILGLSVMDLGTLLQRQAQLSRAEVAVRGWYLPPDPNASCPGRDPIIHSIEPPCDAGRHWLLERPEPILPDPAGSGPRPVGPFLNPVLPSDVRFDLPDTWSDGTPEPVAVILLGHFQDTRSQTREGSQSFVVDGLAWHPGATTDGTGTVTRLTDGPTEEADAVLGRVDAEIGAAIATWTTVVRSSDFPILDPFTPERRPELLNGDALWIVRRLMVDEHARDQLVVDTAYVVDGSNQVWLKPASADTDLETTIDVGPFGDHTNVVQVLDYDHWIVSVRRAAAADNLTWRYTNQPRDGRTRLEVARGASDREVGVRWTGAACAPDWRLLVDVQVGAADPGPWIQPQTFGDGCTSPGEMVTRAVIITFDRPVDPDRVQAVDDRCCG